MRIFALSLVLIFSLSACVPLLVGGAAGGGYYVAKESERKGSLETVVDDTAITASIKAKYMRDSYINALDINVDTDYGVVVLYGNVPDSYTEDRAIALAEGVKGVKRVVSRLVVTPRPE